MVKVASLFSLVLHHFLRAEFAALFKKFETNKNARFFTAWAHFAAMVFGQLASTKSIGVTCQETGALMVG